MTAERDRSRDPTNASRLGIPLDKYQAHRDAGDCWCSWHKAFHPRDAFTANRGRNTGVSPDCRDGAALRKGREPQRDAPLRRRSEARRRGFPTFHTWANPRQETAR